MATSPPGSLANSTQLPCELLWRLFCQTTPRISAAAMPLYVWRIENSRNASTSRAAVLLGVSVVRPAGSVHPAKVLVSASLDVMIARVHVHPHRQLLVHIGVHEVTEPPPEKRIDRA